MLFASVLFEIEEIVLKVRSDEFSFPGGNGQHFVSGLFDRAGFMSRAT